MRASHGAVLCWLLWRGLRTAAGLKSVQHRTRRQICCAAQGKAPKNKSISALASKEKKAKVRCPLCTLAYCIRCMVALPRQPGQLWHPAVHRKLKRRQCTPPAQAADASDFLTELNQLNGNSKSAAKGGVNPALALLTACPEAPPLSNPLLPTSAVWI